MTRRFIAALLVAAGSWAFSGSPASAAEEFEGLPPGEARETVYYNCVACHSMMIIKQQRFTRRVWDEVLDWMVSQHGMPEPDPAERREILDYLVSHFGPGR
jgi:hypothetical protein